ncbi:penicillin-binding protein 2 [Enterococcus faecalis]|nr:penicillin-binding protein 2 [Enterococcus faecalis]
MTFFKNKIIKYFLRAGNNPDFLTIFCYNAYAKLFRAWSRGLKKNSFIDKLKKTDAVAKSQRGIKLYIPSRLHLLFFVIFTLFVSLIVRLGYLQIVEGEEFNKKITANSSLQITTPSPRGQIYDSQGKVLVSNKANLAITYTRGKNIEGKDILPIANKVNELINVPVDPNLTDRDKKDYWLANPENLKAAQARLTDQDKEDEKGNKITDEGTLYAKAVEKVTPEEIAFDDRTLQAVTIFKRMNAASQMNTVFIKNEGVTEGEIATIGEHTAEISGVSTGTDWTRDYSQSGALRSLLGTVSTEKQGLPAEEVDEYLKKGYARNDRVGTSYLEKQYEDVLQGKKAKSEVVLDNNGKIVSQTPISKGEKGSNLKLTIDSNFQNKVDEILQRNYSQIVKTIGPYSENAYVVAMNPQTGAILAMSGVSHDLQTGEVTPNPLGPILNFEVPGSVVKAGTLTAGYEAKVLQGNDTLLDEPIILAGTNPKSSWWNSGGRNAQMQLTAEQALEYSSNAYMMKVVFKLMGVNYYPNMVFPYEIGDDKVFKELRNAYAEYGMGIKTGIDLPGESPGYVNKDFKDPAEAPKGGNLLDLSFGQYDNYTPLQLAQYVSTVANNGIRVQPHVVEGIYGNDENGALGKILKEIEPKVLNKVNISEDQIGILQQGFYNVVNGTSQFTTAPGLKSDKFSIAAKTGTAETQATDANGVVHTTVNSNLVAYAPYENPEIAISVVLPHLNDEESKPNQTIAKEVLEAYMEMYKK